MTRSHGAPAAAAAVALVTVARMAAAATVYDDPMNDSATEIDGIVRSFQFALRGPALDPPIAPPGSNPSGLALEALRAKFDARRGDSFHVVFHDELDTFVSSLPLASAGTIVALELGAQAPLWLPLQWKIAEEGGFIVRDRIDWAYLRRSFGPLTLTVGRQPVTFGRAVLWTPVDLLAPFSPLQIDTEFKPGVDAVRADLAIGSSVTVAVVAVGGSTSRHDGRMTWDGSGVLPRIDLTFGTTRVGLTGGVVRGDEVAGADAFIDLGHGVDLHGEATVTHVGSPSRRPFGRAVFARAVVGSTFELAATFHATIESYWNGSGSSQPDDYVTALQSARVAVGETYNTGMPYTGVAFDWQMIPLVRLQCVALANLRDPSGVISPVLQYDVAQNVELVAGALVPIGRPPMVGASGAPSARSEFGLYPQLYHVDARVYF